VKYGVIEQMRHDYPVPPMCRLLGVSVSGYYAWRKRSPSLRARQEPRLEAEVLAAHRRTRESFGPERLQKHLDEHGVRLGVHRIKRLRKKLGLRCRQKRKFKANDQFEARPTGGTEPAEPGFHCNLAESGLVRRRHVYRD